MSRFGNLEFEQAFEGDFREDATTKDEAYYLAGARGAFQNAEFEKALRWFAKVLEFNPQNTSAWAGQIRALIELGEFHEAALWANKALERFPREPELLAAKAVALGRRGELDEAIAFSDASIEERGDTPYVWLARGDVLLAREEARADYCFDKALALAPGDWVTAWLAARIRFFHKQFVAAMKLLQQAIELNTTHFLLWLQLGQCQLALGLAAPAERSFQQARQLNPQCDAARLGLSQVTATGLWPRLRGYWQRFFHK
jgi:tetratricopeptide (TPR) repeat protein